MAFCRQLLPLCFTLDEKESSNIPVNGGLECATTLTGLASQSRFHRRLSSHEQQASICNVPTPREIQIIPFAFFDSTRRCRYLFLVPCNEKLPPLLIIH